MIKIKIANPTKGRNEPTFRPFFFVKDLLRDYSIDITESDDFDYLFIGMEDFVNKKKSLQDSIDWGVKNLSEIKGDYFLFDGSDSTSLMGSYEVFKQSNAIYLFKNQLLKNKKDYNISSPFNKWFFKGESNLNLSYDIPEEDWKRIKLNGYNLGWLLPDYHSHYSISNDKSYDVCAIYQAYHKENYDHLTRNDEFYTQHRTQVWEQLKNSNFNILTEKKPKPEYLQLLYNSKLAISPFGMGEVCFRDFELMQFGTLMLKPNMSNINTYPNPYIENKTYIPINSDWSNLEEEIEKILGNYKDYLYIVENFRENFKLNYTPHVLCKHWYDIFNNLSSVTTN